jgi:hypothetical protein
MNWRVMALQPTTILAGRSRAPSEESEPAPHSRAFPLPGMFPPGNSRTTPQSGNSRSARYTSSPALAQSPFQSTLGCKYRFLNVLHRFHIQ